MSDTPQKTRIYSTEHFNSERWRGIEMRSDDIVVSTAMKSGTTWMLRIVGLMVFQDPLRVDNQVMHAPWPDAAFAGSTEAANEEANAVTHQRFMKSHIPLDGTYYHPLVKYINVVRDARDHFMSLQHHWAGISEEIYQIFHNYWGKPFPHPEEVGDIHERWRRWISEGRHEWVRDGYPFQSVFNYAESFWKYRHLANILLVHFNDLKSNLEGEMRRVAKFLGKKIPETDWPTYVETATFKSMKRDINQLSAWFNFIFSHGAEGFMHSGKNQSWKNVLSGEDLALYEERASYLAPDLRAWMENGRLVAGEAQDW